MPHADNYYFIVLFIVADAITYYLKVKEMSVIAYFVRIQAICGLGSRQSGDFAQYFFFDRICILFRISANILNSCTELLYSTWGPNYFPPTPYHFLAILVTSSCV